MDNGIDCEFADCGFKLRALKLVQMTRLVAKGFYAVHCERPFFNDLMTFMTSGPTVVLALEKENAIRGSNSLENAQSKLSYFFNATEFC